MDGGRLLIVNADDFGLTPGVCRAVLAAHRSGVVTSTSVLALAPAFELGASMLASGDADRLGVGAHLAAVGEDPPLLSAREIPTLVDRRGRLWRSWRQFVPRVAAGRIDPDDLRREFGSQLQRIRSAGVPLTHVDTHQHLHLWPTVAQVVVEVASRASIGAVRVPSSAASGAKGMSIRRLTRRLETIADAFELRRPTGFAGLDEAGRLGIAVLEGAVLRLGASGVASAELGCHPGEDVDPDRRRYRWGYQWAEELDALRSPEARRAVERAGFRLGTFAQL